MIVFARQPNEPLGQLLIQLDQLLRQEKANSPRIWVTFLSRQQPQLDEKIVAWSKQLGLANLPISVFEDEQGPPAFRLPRDAMVVVVLAKERKIVASRAYTAAEFHPSVVKLLVQEIRAFIIANRTAPTPPK